MSSMPVWAHEGAPVPMHQQMLSSADVMEPYAKMDTVAERLINLARSDSILLKSALVSYVAFTAFVVLSWK